MKITKKIISVLLTLVLTLGLAIPAFAQTGSSESAGEPGQTVTVPFSFTGIKAIQGHVTLSDPNNIVVDGSMTAVPNTTMSGSTRPVDVDKYGFIHYTGDGVKDFELLVTLQLVNDPTLAGKECTLNFTFEYATDYSGMFSDTYTVTIKLELNLDYTELNKQIHIAESLTKADYEIASWEAMQLKLTAAKAINNNAFYQADIDQATNELKAAIAALLKLDYQDLENLISYADSLNEFDYILDSWTAMTTVLTEAKTFVSTSAATTQQQIDDMYDKLQDAINALVKPSDLFNYDALKSYLAFISKLDADDYSPESWARLMELALEGRQMIGKAANQPQIDNMVYRIDLAYDDLEKVMNYEALKDEIEKSAGLNKDDYTAVSWAEFQKVLAAAQKLIGTATLQSEVTAALNNLKAAVDALVDISALNELVDEAAGLLKDNYTALSWQALETALAQVPALTLNGTAAQVAKAYADIEKAMDALIDISALRAAIMAGEAKENIGYTDESWNALQTAIAAGKTLLDNCTKEQADSEAVAIQAAIDALVKPADVVVPVILDYNELKAAIEAAKKISSDGYTALSWNAFQAAISAADALIDKANTQSQIDLALDALEKAEKALTKVVVPPVLNYDALNGAITAVNGLDASKYTAETWADLMKALGAAEALVNKAASQAEIDAAYKALNDAKSALKTAPTPVVPDYKELGKVIGEVRALDESKYTSETWADLMKALGAAEAINNMAATQDEINAACKALKDAKAALKTKPTAPALNYSAIQGEINAAKALKAADYTSETWADLMKALGAAEAINGKAATQAQIDSAKNALSAAIKALKAAPTAPQLNYGKLTEAIADAKKLNSKDYTADAWASIQSILSAAEAINGKAATQAQIDALVAAYNAAKKAIIKPVEIVYTQLTDKFAAANALNEADYTAETWATLKELLNKYRGLVGNAETQSQVDVAAYALQTAIESLVKVTPSADTVELDAQLQAAQGLNKGQYTPGSWEVLQKALTVAEEAKASNDQAAINAAATGLKNAIEALVKVDYTALQAAIDAVGTHAADKNVSQLWNALHGFLEGAKDLMENGADQATIDALVTKINDQLSQIEKEVEDLEKEEIKFVDKIVNVPTDPVDPFCNKSGHTVNTILMWASAAINLAAIAVVITYFVLKKKKENDETPLVDYSPEDDE